MKSKCSFILKASLAMVLALVMLFGTVATSLAAVVEDDLADTAAQAEEIADTGADADVADEGAEADLADTSYSIGQMKKLCLKKSDGSWVEYTLSNGAYTVNITTAGTYNFKFYVDNGNYLTNTGNISNSVSGWQLSYMSDTTNPGSLNVSTTGNYTFTLTESSGNIYMSILFPSSGGGDSGGTSGGNGTAVTGNLLDILNEVSVMLYVCGYKADSPKSVQIVNSSGLYPSEGYYCTRLTDYWSAIQIKKADLKTNGYNLVSNNSKSENGSWEGGDDAEQEYLRDTVSESWGGQRVVSQGGTKDADGASTGSTTLSKDTVNRGTDLSITLTSKMDSTQYSSYTDNGNKQIKYRYYYHNQVDDDDEWYRADIADVNASTSNQDSTFDISSLAAGTYDIITIFYDGNINYIGDKDTLTITNYTYALALPSIENATVTAAYTLNGESEAMAEGDTDSIPTGVTVSVTVTVVPDDNYKVTNIQGTAKTGFGTKTETVSVSAATIISAIVVEKTKYTVTTANNDSTLGTIGVNTSASDYTSSASVYEGATVYYKAAPTTGKLTKVVVKNTTANSNISSTTYDRTDALSSSFTMPSGNVEVAATFQEYTAASKYYYDGWKNDNSNNYAVSSGTGWNNVNMTEALYNGQKYAYFHITEARPDHSSANKFSITKKESGTRYVYFNDHGSWNDGEYWRQSYGGKPTAVFEDVNGKQIASSDMTWVSGSGDAVDKIWKVAIPDDERAYQVYFTNNHDTNWRKTKVSNIDHGLYERGSWSSDAYLLNWAAGWGDDYTDAGGMVHYYWGSPSGTDQTYESDRTTCRFGSDLVLSYADIGSYTNNTSMVRPYYDTVPTDYYIIVYYPNTDYGTINGVTANNSNSYPIVVAATELPSTSANRVTIYAKDGCINEDRNSTRVIGTTDLDAEGSIIKGESRGEVSSIECYTYARALRGEEITITTTISDTYASKYVVKGWDVNGDTYGLDPTPVGNAYSTTITVPDDEIVEITPIYWLKSTYDTTTFFVKDFNKVPSEWGTALYYYYWGGSQVNVDNEEKYPGQPFVHEGGQYYAQLPSDVTGVTLNNAVWDDIHGRVVMGLSPDDSYAEIKAAHYQTYDYDNFAKIAAEKSNINSVYFTFKYENKKNNFDYNSGSTTSITVADYNDSNGNGWEEYKDPLGRSIDILGNKIETAGTGKLYAVSNGYARNYQGCFATEWSIYYDSTGTGSTATYVCTIPSSALVLDAATDFDKAAYASNYGPALSTYKPAWTTLNSNYSSVPVYVSYEKADNQGLSKINTSGAAPSGAGGTTGHEDPATRMDGKWDYTSNDDFVTANIKVQLSDDNGITYSDDAFTTDTNTGTTTGAQAFFNNDGEDYQNKHVVTVDDEIPVSTTDKFLLKTVPQPSTGYVFVGWYRQDDGSENPELISKATEASSLMSAKATFIARYKLVTSGTLVVNHVASGAGSAMTHTVKAEIFNADDDVATATPVAKFEGASATIDDTYINSSSTYKIRITLVARAGANSYIANSSAVPTVTCSQAVGTYYSNPSYAYSERFAASTYPVNITTTVATFTVSSLYTDTTQNFTVLNYTTTFNRLPSYTINYKYHGRQSGDGYLTFARTITLSPDEAEGKNATGENYYGNNGTPLRPTYRTQENDGLVNDITANAPDTNDLSTTVFNKNITWSASAYSTGSPTDSSVNILATESDPTYTLSYTYYDSNGTSHSDTVTAAYNTLIRFGESGTHVTASTKDGQRFAYWADANNNPLTSSILYSMRLIDNVTIHPVYGASASGWTSAIDKITRTHETSDSSDYVFTDLALRYSGFESGGQFIHINPDHTDKYRIGVAIVFDTDGNNTSDSRAQINGSAFYSLSDYTDAQHLIQTMANSNYTSAKLKNVSPTTHISLFDADPSLLTNLNRIDYAVKYNYNTYYKRQYDAYAYIIDTTDASGGSNGTVIAVSSVKSGNIYDGTLPTGNGN